MQRALPFVAIVCAVSAITVAFVASRSVGEVTSGHIAAALMLAALGVAAEMLNYEAVKGAVSGSISLVPFAAAALCTPTWAAIAAIGTGAAVVQVNVVIPQTLADRRQQRAVQLAAVDADFRDRIARMAAARLAVDELAEAVEEHALEILDSLGFDLGLHAQRRQLAHGVRQERDADADVPDLGRRLVDIAGQAALRGHCEPHGN